MQPLRSHHLFSGVKNKTLKVVLNNMIKRWIWKSFRFEHDDMWHTLNCKFQTAAAAWASLDSTTVLSNVSVHGSVTCSMNEIGKLVWFTNVRRHCRCRVANWRSWSEHWVHVQCQIAHSVNHRLGFLETKIANLDGFLAWWSKEIYYQTESITLLLVKNPYFPFISCFPINTRSRRDNFMKNQMNELESAH